MEMDTKDSPDVDGPLATLCDGIHEKIYDESTQKSELEGWPQGEFLDQIRNNWKDTAVEREQKVFANPKLQADILIRRSQRFKYNTIIELKCELVFQDITEFDETHDLLSHFISRFEHNISKIKSGIADDSKPAHCWVLAITRAQQIAKDPAQVAWKHNVGHHQFGYSDILTWHWYKWYDTSL